MPTIISQNPAEILLNELDATTNVTASCEFKNLDCSIVKECTVTCTNGLLCEEVVAGGLWSVTLSSDVFEVQMEYSVEFKIDLNDT
jgi:hypothetical protein